jgi:hypothetical protein
MNPILDRRRRKKKERERKKLSLGGAWGVCGEKPFIFSVYHNPTLDYLWPSKNSQKHLL